MHEPSDAKGLRTYVGFPALEQAASSPVDKVMVLSLIEKKVLY